MKTFQKNYLKIVCRGRVGWLRMIPTSLGVALAFGRGIAEAQPEYYAQYIGFTQFYGGYYASQAGGVNNDGQEAFSSYTPLQSNTDEWGAYLNNTSGGPTYLGTLGGYESEANGINDYGQVVGVSDTASEYNHAFLYSNGTMTDLGTLGGSESSAYGINNSGQVVGEAQPAGSTTFHAFLCSNGTMQDLGTLGGLGGGESEAYGINRSGQIVGQASISGDTATHAFLYSAGQMTDLGTLGGTYSVAYAINNEGQVVGSATALSGANHAFVFSEGKMTDLGTLGAGTFSEAQGINDSGQVVGMANINPNGPDIYHAFIYTGGTMYDLNNLVTNPIMGQAIYDAAGINDSGQILALSGDPGGGTFGGAVYLLTPVPEPASLAFVFIGVTYLVTRRLTALFSCHCQALH